MSISLGVDAPTLMMLGGAAISVVAPEIGLPIALAGAMFEICPLTGDPLCVGVKLSSVGGVLTVDKYGHVYLGPEFSFGKSITPVVGGSFNMGMILTDDHHVATEAETQDFLQGWSFSAGTIATGGVAYSPATNTSAYYLVGAPEIFSGNVSYSWELP